MSQSANLSTKKNEIKIFKNSVEFCEYLEYVKKDNGFATYMESILWVCESRGIAEEDIVSMLTDNVKAYVELEARKLNMMKDNSEILGL